MPCIFSASAILVSDYNILKANPTSNTLSYFSEQAKIIIAGPLFPDKSFLLTAYQQGQPKMIKLLRTVNDFSVSSTVKELHSHEIIHMDVKADNIFVDAGGKWK
jgi:serine/threonine protein kinase